VSEPAAGGAGSRFVPLNCQELRKIVSEETAMMIGTLPMAATNARLRMVFRLTGSLRFVNGIDHSSFDADRNRQFDDQA
jgi:hypothetical protein